MGYFDFYAVQQIQRTNKRRKAGGQYLIDSELRETLEDAYPSALKGAALEALKESMRQRRSRQWLIVISY